MKINEYNYSSNEVTHTISLHLPTSNKECTKSVNDSLSYIPIVHYKFFGTCVINDIGDWEIVDYLPHSCDIFWQVLPGELLVANHCCSTPHMLFSNTWTSTLPHHVDCIGMKCSEELVH